MTAEQLRRFRERLEAERAAIEARIAGLHRDIQTTVSQEDGVGDSGDESIRLYDREVESSRSDLDQAKVRQIDRALGRIEAGTYGISEVSGKPIPTARLEAVPSATTLVDEEAPDTRG